MMLAMAEASPSSGPGDRVETDNVTVTLRDDGVAYWLYKQGAVETEASAREAVELYRAAAAGRRLPFIVDIRNVRSADRSARAFPPRPAMA
jgi:hypothetical protein